MYEIEIKPAQASDFRDIVALLTKSDLPTEDLTVAAMAHFYVARNAGNQIIGAVALEPHGESGLLRSLAITPNQQGAGLGSELLDKVFCSANGVKRVYLLTETAPGFFSKHGFNEIERASAPAEIRSTREFSSICPVDAICMIKIL